MLFDNGVGKWTGLVERAGRKKKKGNVNNYPLFTSLSSNL